MSSLGGIVVYKMSGSGNDFVLIDGRATPVDFWTPNRVREVCARQTGVGADGLAVVEPGSEQGTIRLHYFNADGHRAELCGNASLCAVRLAAWIELEAPWEGVTLETDAGPVRARCLPGPGERAEIHLGEVSGITRPLVGLERDEREARFVRVGVPHLVVLVDDLTSVDVSGRGRALRSHRAFGSEGANVDFVGRGSNGWSVRTFERGVEAETLACGTGAVAVATVLAEEGLHDLPVDLLTASGCHLSVKGARASPGTYRDLSLTGEGRLVFRAILGG